MIKYKASWGEKIYRLVLNPAVHCMYNVILVVNSGVNFRYN